MGCLPPRHMAFCQLLRGGEGDVVALPLSLRKEMLGAKSAAALLFTHRYERPEAQGHLSRGARDHWLANTRETVALLRDQKSS